MRSRDEVRALMDSVLTHVTADEAQVDYEFEQRTGTRFAENAITQNASGASEQITVHVVFGAGEGSASTNRLDADDLRQAVARAEEIARHAPANPEYVPLPGPQEYGAVPEAFFAETADLPPERIADDVVRVIDPGKALGYAASGHFEVAAEAEAVANSNGLFAYDRRTRAGYSATLHGPAGSSKFSVNEDNHAAIDVGRLADGLLAGAVAAQDPVAIEPGDYNVIFEPLATAEFLTFLLYSMSARAADEGSTAFAGAVGTKIAGDLVTLRLRTDSAALPAAPFGTAGLAVRPVTWIDRGVLTHLHHDRYWAAQQGVDADAARTPMFMDGGERSVDDLVGQCKRGLLVKNLWYIRFVDQKELLLTGMTRDGLFLVEDGRVVRPVKNLRWNESPIVFLRNAVALSRPERVGTRPWVMLPGVLSEGFTFTSTTDSV